MSRSVYNLFTTRLRRCIDIGHWTNKQAVDEWMDAMSMDGRFNREKGDSIRVLFPIGF